MAAYHNPQGSVNGTPDADSFVFDTPVQSVTTVDGLAGVDQLTVDYGGASLGSYFRATDLFNNGTFFGRVDVGAYSPLFTFYNFEDVSFVGSAYDDGFEFVIRPASSALAVNADGGAGTDQLILDVQTLTSGLTFRVENGVITSSFGTFANFEKFRILAGSGNDVIRTGDLNDYVYAGTGSDDIRTGGGQDDIYSESGGDYADMGADYDHFQGNYSATTAALTVDLGETLTVSNGVSVINAESFTIGTGSGDDRINLTRGVSATIYGGPGYDTLASAALLDGPQHFEVYGNGGSLGGFANQAGFTEIERVELQGGAYEDVFNLSGLFAAASVAFDGGGGGGVDRLHGDFSLLAGASSLIVAADGTIASNRGAFAAIEQFVLRGGSGADVFVTYGYADSLGGAGGDDYLDGGGGGDSIGGGDGNDQLFGGAGDDLLVGEADDDLLDGGAGDDSMFGGAGNDVYVVDSGADAIIEAAGEGMDEIRTALAAYSLAALPNVENLTGTSAAGQTLTGNAGNNVITGGAGNDTLRLYDGGVDTANGGAGNDNLFFIGTLTGADIVNGGAGVDTLVLQGAYGALTLTANVTQIENLSILGGNNTNFGEPGTNRYDYGLTTNDANFAAGVQARINGAALLEGEDFTFDGSAETNASFVVYGGKGRDTLTGGLGNDIFFYAEERFASGDTVNGGPGYDGMFLRGNYTIDFNAPGYTGLFTNIENLTLTSATDERYARGGGSEFDYNLTLSDAIVGAGQTLTVSGALLMATETMILDGSQETDGILRLFGGKAADTLKGGSGADYLHGNLGADTLAGGGGADLFRYDSTAESNLATMDQILDFTPGTDRFDLTRIDANTLVGGDQAFTWIGSGAFTSSAGQLRAYETNGSWFVEGDTNGDGVADLVIQLTLQGPTPLGAGDFIL